MAQSKAKDSSWTATHRYGDVYECSNGGTVALSHSERGLRVAQASLEEDGSDGALLQLKVIEGKLSAIAAAGPPPIEAPAEAPAEDAVETEAGEE